MKLHISWTVSTYCRIMDVVAVETCFTHSYQLSFFYFVFMPFHLIQPCLSSDFFSVLIIFYRLRRKISVHILCYILFFTQCFVQINMSLVPVQSCKLKKLTLRNTMLYYFPENLMDRTLQIKQIVFGSVSPMLSGKWDTKNFKQTKYFSFL